MSEVQQQKLKKSFEPCTKWCGQICQSLSLIQTETSQQHDGLPWKSFVPWLPVSQRLFLTSCFISFPHFTLKSFIFLIRWVERCWIDYVAICCRCSWCPEWLLHVIWQHQSFTFHWNVSSKVTFAINRMALKFVHRNHRL